VTNRPIRGAEKAFAKKTICSNTNYIRQGKIVRDLDGYIFERAEEGPEGKRAMEKSAKDTLDRNLSTNKKRDKRVTYFREDFSAHGGGETGERRGASASKEGKNVAF